MVLIQSFNSMSPMIGLAIALFLFSYAVAMMVEAGKTKPPTQRDIGDFMFGLVFILAAIFILIGVKDSWFA